MVDEKSTSWFFAYGGKPSLRAETMRGAVSGIRKAGGAAQSWEDLRIKGGILIDSITAAIDDHASVVAEVSDLNPNVLFEAGYALARGKHVWLAFDETDEEAAKSWKELGILATIGRVNYSASSDSLVSQCLVEDPERVGSRPLLERLLAGGKSRQPEAVFAPPLPSRIQPAISLEAFLERQSHLQLLGAGEDLGMAPLDFYVKEIYRSSAAVFHLLAERRVRAREHNARASLMAGIAHGFELPVLMVVEDGFESPLDYRDLLYKYDSTAALIDHVRSWLDTLPKQAGTNKRLGRLALDIELPIRSFGQFVAEYEREELTDYFVETSEFRSILAGDAKVFVGRKGTGKTATMSQAVEELRRDRRNLVVSVKPSAYELAGLMELVSRLGAGGHSEYLMVSLWSYLLHTEIAVRAVRHASEKPAGTGTNTDLQALAAELDELDVALDDDLSTRLERAIERLAQEDPRDGEAPQAFVGRMLRLNRLGALRELVLRTIRDFDRVAVLIDNLDKTWEKGVDYSVMARFILALLTSIGRVEREFSKPPSGLSPARVTLSIFLRTDIYDAIARFAREPDKVGVLSVRWQDPELLVRVLEERYAANRSRKKNAAFDMWSEVFDLEVRGLPTRDYFLWRTLSRPRDLIFFANASLTTAINRKHSRITAADVILAEKQYSRFAIEALLVESDAEEFNLEEVLYEFAGLDCTLQEEELADLFAAYGNAASIRDWLVRTSFLGVEVRSGEFVHVEGETDSRRQVKVAERFASRNGSKVRYRIHPAFRPFLEVRDDDLHRGDLRDITLDLAGEDGGTAG